MGEVISDLQLTPYRLMHDGLSGGGRLSRVHRRVGLKVRIVHERFTDDALGEKLYTMGDHLERGGAVSFAVDSAKTFAAFIDKKLGETYGIGGGGEVFRMHAPIFDSYSTTPPAVDDVLIVESFGANAKREELRCASYDKILKKLTTQTPLLYAHSGPTMVRHRDFFPALHLPATAAGALLTHDHRISWTWDATLEAYPAHLRELYVVDPQDIAPTDAVGGRTIDEIIGGPSLKDEITIGDYSPIVGGAASPIASAIAKIEKIT
jgi:hypothetical protein